MLSIVANVFYILIAIAMVVLILLQRGAGANAGSGFGGGASATVFGARGSANFLSRSTAVLGGLFFLLSLGMGMFLARPGVSTAPMDDLGVMSGVAVPATPAATPTSGDGVPQPAGSADTPAPAAAPSPAAAAPATEADKPAAPPAAAEADGSGEEGKDGK
jgi:preprotein translocase subunit SecG